MPSSKQVLRQRAFLPLNPFLLCAVFRLGAVSEYPLAWEGGGGAMGTPALCTPPPPSWGRCPSLSPSVLRSCSLSPRDRPLSLWPSRLQGELLHGVRSCGVENTLPPSKHHRSGASVKISLVLRQKERAGFTGRLLMPEPERRAPKAPETCWT